MHWQGMHAHICCIREMVRVALARPDCVYIDFNMLHSPMPDNTCIVSFVWIINIRFLTLLSLLPEWNTVRFTWALSQDSPSEELSLQLFATLLLSSHQPFSSAAWSLHHSPMAWTLPKVFWELFVEIHFCSRSSQFVACCSKLHFTVKVTAFSLWGLQGKQPLVSICEHTCSLCLRRVSSTYEVIIFL